MIVCWRGCRESLWHVTSHTPVHGASTIDDDRPRDATSTNETTTTSASNERARVNAVADSDEPSLNVSHHRIERPSWPAPGREYVRFVLAKENRESLDALDELARRMRVPVKIFSVSGTKACCVWNPISAFAFLFGCR